MEANSWHILADDGKEKNTLLFCFVLSQECLRNSIPVPNEEIVFKHISTYLRALLLGNWEKFCMHIRRTEMMLFFLLFYGIFTVGVNIFLLECPGEPGRAKAWAGSTAHWDSEGFCSLGIWRCMQHRCGSARPIGSGQAGASCCSSAEAGDSHHRLIHRWDTGGSLLPALCCLHRAGGWGGQGGGQRDATALQISRVSPSLLLPCSSPHQGSHHRKELLEKIIVSLKPASISLRCVCVPVNPGSGKEVLWVCCCSCYC